MVWIAEHILTAINHAKPRDCFTRRDVELATGMTDKQVENACGKLKKHGLIEQAERGCLNLTAAGRAAVEGGKTLRSGPRGEQPGARAKRVGLRVRAWRAMRLRRKFAVADLLTIAAEGGERNPESNLLKYIKALTRAGILIELPHREAALNPTSNGCKRWWLRDEANTGPEAPAVSVKRGAVYDPNTETYHDLA